MSHRPDPRRERSALRLTATILFLASAITGIALLNGLGSSELTIPVVFGLVASSAIIIHHRPKRK